MRFIVGLFIIIGLQADNMALVIGSILFLIFMGVLFEK